MIVSKTTFKRTDQKYANVINKYTKLDPTLPRVSNIPCPNEQCPCNRAEDPIAKEVIYIRYDDTNLKFVYLCAHCDTIWKSGE
jgi:aspartate carbamoyltransferase regulatory subunit